MKILMLNAPPRAGKDTMAEYFEEEGWTHLKFSKVLKVRTHALYGYPQLPYDYFEDRKDMVLEEFKGITPRQAYINLSEMLMKPAHGDSIWADFLADLIQKTIGSDKFVISDLGFQVEWETFIDRFGWENIAAVQIHRDGCNFDNDSREWVDPDNFRYIDGVNDPKAYSKYLQDNFIQVQNDGSLGDLYDKCTKIERQIL